MDQIIIKQNYFDNIKTAVNGINKFFESEFQIKNFPVDTTELDWAIANIIELLDDLDPAYVSDNRKLDNTLDMISDSINNSTTSTQQILSNRPIRNAIQSIVSYSALIDISNDFDTFNKFINGIYSFDLFMHPSKYKNEILKYSANLKLPDEIEDIDLETSIFDTNQYVYSLFDNPDINFPESMNVNGEIERILAFRDSQNTEVVIDDRTDFGTNETPTEQTPVEQPSETTPEQPVNQPSEQTTTESFYIMEAALTFPCENVRFSNNKFQISSQYKSEIDKIISNFRKCNDVSDVKDFMKNFKMPSAIDIPFPYIFVKALSDRLSEHEFETLKIENENVFKKKATKKTVSKISHYSLYDLFKIDKDSTINFLEDYFKLNLVNNSNAAISNNILLALFNIFDSRVYLLSMYNVKNDNSDSNAFISEIRKRINANSKATNTYQKSAKDTITDSIDPDTIKESIDYRIKDYGNITIEEISICEGYRQIINDEINLIDSLAYNNGMSKNDIDNLITEESYAVIESELFRNRPAAHGDVPAYMLSRIDVSDKDGGEFKEPPTIDIPDPVFEEPKNSVDDLADSVSEKMGMDGNLDELIGSGFNGKQVDPNGRIVYNITYNNSFNKRDSHNTSNDLSQNKRISRTNTNSNNISNQPPKNNNDNSNNSLDSKEFEEHVIFYGDRQFSNGMSVAEMFMLLESEEPLSMEAVAINAGKPPTADSLTKAMDKDRESLAKTQEAKRKVQKLGNTIRAKTKPISRVKQWLTNVVNSLIERDETKVKEEIIENPSYRTALYKALRLSIKLGLAGVAFTISSWLGTAVVGLQVAKFADKQRLRREVQDEMVTELQVIDEKIAYAKKTNNQQELYRLLRVKGRLQNIAADTSRGRWNTVQPQRKWY